MLVKLYIIIYSLINMHCTKIITYLYINAGILQLLCKGKAVQKYLTLGTKIDECGIAITDDAIISQPIETIKQYLTEEAWLKLSQEGMYSYKGCMNTDIIHIFSQLPQ